MPNLPPEDAVERARVALRVDPSIPGRARHVRRLDRPGADYFLVTLGAETATVGIVTLDANTGELQGSVSLPGVRGHFAVDEERARAVAGGGISAELVWRPSAISHSPLYPIWEVRTEEGLVYVDQRGDVWTSIPEAGRRGAPPGRETGARRPPRE